MPQSLDSVILHLVFSTKKRVPFLNGGIRDEVHRYLAETARRLGSIVYRVGGVEDHVHFALTLPRTIAVSRLVKELKVESSNMVKRRPEGDRGFAWQAGYGVFSISHTHREGLVRHIETQEEHHRTVSFQDEFRALLAKHEMEWDEAYVWD